MPFYPEVPEIAQTKVVTSIFRGYNRNLEIGEGSDNHEPLSSLEFSDMQNLTSDYYPLLANRQKRGVMEHLSAPGGIIAKEEIAYVDNGTLYYGGVPTKLNNLTSGKKQLVSMGAYLVIWPDKVYFNTKNPDDYGSIDMSFPTTGYISYSLCGADFQDIDNIATDKPYYPSNGQYWMDTSTTPHSLKIYNSTTGMWVSVATVYVKISSTGIGQHFNTYDGVTLSGIRYSGTEADIVAQYEDLNGSKIIQARSDDYIVVVGLISKTSTQTSGVVTVKRESPDMDFVTEAGNRLWGCKYGEVGGKPINEIYACALGDFRNWNQYQGISTDSYTASVGTDGKWTGAITHLGYPIFFKENVLHKVYISSSGAHQIQDTACRGVQDGCAESLAIVGERLYYKSRAGVMMYDGSLPDCVSDALGTEKYSDASAGAIDDKYYISMMDSDDKWHLFVFDTAKGLWHREDATHALEFARLNDHLLYIDADTSEIVDVSGNGEAEDDIEWYATTGLIGYTTVEQKYISRFNLRMMLPKGSRADMYLMYDSSGVWEHCGHMEGQGTKTFMLPVRPRRCDHFHFRIEGKGDVRIYSMSKIFEVGSDVT